MLKIYGIDLCCIYELFLKGKKYFKNTYLGLVLWIWYLVIIKIGKDIF